MKTYFLSHWRLPMGLVLAVALVVWLLWANTAPQLTHYQVISPNIPAGFDGVRIAQVSDLHNDQLGEDNRRLLELLEEAEPDDIVITGDLVDSRRTDLEVALAFAAQAAELAPCFYITGNHEARIEEWPQLRDGLEQAGITVLENEAVVLEQNGDTLSLLGLHAPGFPYGEGQDTNLERIGAVLAQLCQSTDGYQILLAHHPEYCSAYAQSGVDLVFSGHAHGGQVRLPVVGGLYAPGQGFLPQYDNGLYQEGDTTLVVSRGLGNSLFPLRIGNRPEVVVVTLQCA